MYDARVLASSRGSNFRRGELEITDVNNDYAQPGEMTFDTLRSAGGRRHPREQVEGVDPRRIGQRRYLSSVKA
jgi:hypothetical protein